MVWKAITGVFDKETRQQKAFDKLVAKLVSKSYQTEDRLAAIDYLAEEGSDRSISALFRRWDLTSDKVREDTAEKEYLAEVLVRLGPKIIPHLQDHNDRSVNVTRPIQVLGRLCATHEVVEEIIRVLGREQDRVASFRPEKKIQLIRLLGDYSDERIAAALLRSIDDFDADVRFEAIRVLGELGDVSVADPLIDRLAEGGEEVSRIRSNIIEALAQLEVDVRSRRADVQEDLGDRFEIDKAGRIVAKT